jgi:aminomethyltransferase
MCLFGQDIDDRHTPIEAGLGFLVKANKGDYLGKEILLRQLQEGTVEFKLVGFETLSRESNATDLRMGGYRGR